MIQLTIKPHRVYDGTAHVDHYQWGIAVNDVPFAGGVESVPSEMIAMISDHLKNAVSTEQGVAELYA